MYAFKYLRRYGRQYLANVISGNNLRFLIFFVTSRCNCRCATCFYWKELNQPKELSLDEIKKISASLGAFHTLLFSGGEPFLREDILEISRVFIEHNKISVLSVPTNGTYPLKIAEFSRKLLNEYPGITLSIAVSLDGFRQTHDAIRGVEGTFDKAMESLKGLLELKTRYNNLEVVVNTVITDRNAAELEPFADFIYNDLNNLDYHEFELLRGEYRDTDLSLPPADTIKRIHRVVARNRERYLRRAKAYFPEVLSVMGLLLFTQKIKERFLLGKKNYYRCSAGRNAGVIDANGDVRLCELSEPVGNVTCVNYEFSRVWKSAEADKLRAKFTSQRCSCTHICFIKLTISSYLRTLFYIIHSYLLYKCKKRQ